jgi:hypothetical protein
MRTRHFRNTIITLRLLLLRPFHIFLYLRRILVKNHEHGCIRLASEHIVSLPIMPTRLLVKRAAVGCMELKWITMFRADMRPCWTQLQNYMRSKTLLKVLIKLATGLRLCSRTGVHQRCWGWAAYPGKGASQLVATQLVYRPCRIHRRGCILDPPRLIAQMDFCKDSLDRNSFCILFTLRIMKLAMSSAGGRG